MCGLNTVVIIFSIAAVLQSVYFSVAKYYCVVYILVVIVAHSNPYKYFYQFEKNAFTSSRMAKNQIYVNSSTNGFMKIHRISSDVVEKQLNAVPLLYAAQLPISLLLICVCFFFLFLRCFEMAMRCFTVDFLSRN